MKALTERLGSNKGFTILEVFIGISAMTATGFALTSLFAGANLQSANLQAKVDASDAVQEVKMALVRPPVCKANLAFIQRARFERGQTQFQEVSFITANGSLDSSREAISAVDQNGKIHLTDMSVENFREICPGSGEYLAQLRMNFGANRNRRGGTPLVRHIPIFLQFNPATNALVSCTTSADQISRVDESNYCSGGAPVPPVPVNVGQPADARWVNVNSSRTTQAAACAAEGLVPVTPGFDYGICASGENRPNFGEDYEEINYYLGTWGPGPEIEPQDNLGVPVGRFCYKPGQVRDNDRTDRIVAWLCKP